jgi:hypothetical protein
MENKLHTILLVISIVCTLSLIGVILYVPYQLKTDMKRCFDAASISYPADDQKVTSQDVSRFQKDFLACISD